MGRLAVYKFAYLLSIIFTLLILGLSVFAYFAGRIDPPVGGIKPVHT